MAKSNFTPKQRANITQEYLDGLGASSQIATKYGINGYTVRRWAQKYTKQGISAFSISNGNTSYSADFKMSCVEMYLQGKTSMDQIVA